MRTTPMSNGTIGSRRSPVLDAQNFGAAFLHNSVSRPQTAAARRFSGAEISEIALFIEIRHFLAFS
jgi:hypothetical protein